MASKVKAAVLVQAIEDENGVHYEVGTPSGNGKFQMVFGDAAFENVVEFVRGAVDEEYADRI